MQNSEIKQTIEDLLKAGAFEYEDVLIIEKNNIGPVFSIKTKDSGLLIGPEGDTLRQLNFIIKRIVAKKADPEREPAFSVDINDYRDSSLKILEQKVKMMVDRAISFKTSVELDPMSSYERMYTHSLLANIPNIKTESTGEGKERRVVIKFVEDKNTL